VVTDEAAPREAGAGAGAPGPSRRLLQGSASNGRPAIGIPHATPPTKASPSGYYDLVPGRRERLRRRLRCAGSPCAPGPPAFHDDRGGCNVC